MDKAQAIACWRSIRRNHPFFKGAGYQPWSWDWRTFRMLYPRTCWVIDNVIRPAARGDRG